MISIIDDDVGKPRQRQEPDRRIGKLRFDDADSRMIAQAARCTRHCVPEGAGGGRIVAGNPAGAFQEVATRLGREDSGGHPDDSSITESISTSTSSSS